MMKIRELIKSYYDSRQYPWRYRQKNLMRSRGLNPRIHKQRQSIGGYTVYIYPNIAEGCERDFMHQTCCLRMIFAH